MAVKRCVFCRQTGQKISGEHVFPDWIRRASDDQKAGATYFRRKGDGTVETWRQVAYTTKVNDVCERCNTGWMSTIEAAVSDRVAPMIFEGARVTIAADDLRTVATWVTLRALVIQLATGHHEVPAEHSRISPSPTSS